MALSKRKQSGETALLTHSTSIALRESFRDLKAKLSLCLAGDGAKTLAITSTSKKDGQATVASNLALTFASSGTRVVIIDANPDCNALSSLFNVEKAESTKLTLSRKDGLKNYVVSVYHGLESNVDFVPLNQVEQDGASIDDNAVASLIQSLKESYDFIIINAPPALSVASMNTFASVCDGFALVCKKYSSRIANVQIAINILHIVNANVLGVIVNDNK